MDPAAEDPMEEELNLFLDGELPLERQGELYAHLSRNIEARSFMDQVLLFRRMSRQEYLEVPPAVDESFFAKLDALKSSGERVDRFLEREPLWNSRKPVSLRAAIAAVVAVFMVGWLLPLAGDEGQTSFIAQEEERVLFDMPQTRVMQSYIYVFEPGLTIEAEAE
jgi:anti-sigma factor RsiW